MSKPVIFISYSHNDERFKDRLNKHLRVLQNEDLLDSWDDRRIEFGDDWRPRILSSINSAAAAVLLISTDFLTSKFIMTEEVPKLLQRRASDGMKIFPVIVGYCPWQRVAWLNGIQVLPKDGKPLADLNPNKRDKTLSAIAIEIADILNSIEASHIIEPVHTPRVVTAQLMNFPSRKPFVGRNELLQEIERRLQSDRTIGLVGMAGMGKSALALEAAYRFEQHFPDGRYWFDLRSFDITGAVRGLLQTLGRSVESNYNFDELCRAASDELSGKRALLILDNAEGVDTQQRNQLAAICPTTIITSRKSINHGRDLRIDELSNDDAMALFRQSGLDVDAQPEDALKLIERLGGLALALVTTARRMELYSPPQTCAQALTELSRSASLINTLQLPLSKIIDDNVAESFALSYTGLDVELQASFHALGLCAPSGATAQAIAAMLEIGEREARELMLVLAERSLVDFDGERAEMHPLMHEYARMRAEQQPDQLQAMIVRHVTHFGLEIGGSYQRSYNEDQDSSTALQLIDLNSDNVLLAQKRAINQDFPDPELPVKVTVGLSIYWQHRNVNTDQLLTWFKVAVRIAAGAGMRVEQANVLKAIGDVQQFRDQRDDALASYEQALALFIQVGAKPGQANVRLSKGRMSSDKEEFGAAIRSYEEIGDIYSIARGKTYFGEWLVENGEKERGLNMLNQARESWIRINLDWGVSWVDGILKKGDSDDQ